MEAESEAFQKKHPNYMETCEKNHREETSVFLDGTFLPWTSQAASQDLAMFSIASLMCQVGVGLKVIVGGKIAPVFSSEKRAQTVVLHSGKLT